MEYVSGNGAESHPWLVPGEDGHVLDDMLIGATEALMRISWDLAREHEFLRTHLQLFGPSWTVMIAGQVNADAAVGVAIDIAPVIETHTVYLMLYVDATAKISNARSRWSPVFAPMYAAYELASCHHPLENGPVLLGITYDYASQRAAYAIAHARRRAYYLEARIVPAQLMPQEWVAHVGVLDRIRVAELPSHLASISLTPGDQREVTEGMLRTVQKTRTSMNFGVLTPANQFPGPGWWRV